MSATAKKKLTFDPDIAPATPAAAPRRTAPKASAEATEARQQIGVRLPPPIYRQLKARAALQGTKIQDLLEQAITEYLANHPD